MGIDDLIVAIYRIVFGEKPLAEIVKNAWSRSKQKKASLESTPQSTLPDASDGGTMENMGIVRFNKYIENTKILVSSSQYDKAVNTAQKARDEIITIGDLNNPEIRLILGELDVWYAHALMYTGETSKALEILKTTDDALRGKRHQYEDMSSTWCLVLGLVHNHIGYVYWMDLGHYEIALSEFYNARSYFLESGLKEELATAYDNMGRVYAQLGYQTRAELLIEHGRQLREEINSRYRLALSLNSQAIAYLNFGQSNHALNINEQALKIFEEQQKEKGLRGKGLALLTKARALRQISTTQHLEREDGLKMLREVIHILEEANRIFEDVGEDVRQFQVHNELGCAYRDQAILLMQSSDRGSAHRQAKNSIPYLKKSIEITKGDENEIKYRVHYVDACEDLAQTYLVRAELGNDRDKKRWIKEAGQWIEQAENTIPNIYIYAEKVQPGTETAQPERIPARDCFEEFWQQLGKIYWLRGQIIAKEAPLSPECIEAYVLAAAYFGRFLERPIDNENHHLYSPYRPLLGNHRKFTKYIYTAVKDWDIEDTERLQDTALPAIKKRYGLKQTWIEELFDEPFSFALQMRTRKTL